MKVYNMRETLSGYPEQRYFYINGKRTTHDKFEQLEIKGRMYGNFSNFATINKPFKRTYTKTLTIK